MFWQYHYTQRLKACNPVGGGSLHSPYINDGCTYLSNKLWACCESSGDGCPTPVFPVEACNPAQSKAEFHAGVAIETGTVHIPRDMSLVTSMSPALPFSELLPQNKTHTHIMMETPALGLFIAPCWRRHGGPAGHYHQHFGEHT